LIIDVCAEVYSMEIYRYSSSMVFVPYLPDGGGPDQRRDKEVPWNGIGDFAQPLLPIASHPG
jgi:hypothetical protein